MPFFPDKPRSSGSKTKKRYPYENCYPGLKTGCVAANADAVRITFPLPSNRLIYELNSLGMYKYIG